MNSIEFELLFELVDRFHLLDICNFMDEFLMGYYSCDDAIFQNAHSVIVTPMKEVDMSGRHKLKDKSGDVVFLCLGKRELFVSMRQNWFLQ